MGTIYDFCETGNTKLDPGSTKLSLTAAVGRELFRHEK